MRNYISVIGIFILLFLASCGDDEEPKVDPPIENEIVTYNDITLGGRDLQGTIGSVFSTETGLVYKDTDYTAEVGPKIDIAFVGITSLRFFESPALIDNDWEMTPIPGETTTAFINVLDGSGISFTTEMFDAMTDDTPIKDLTIVADDNAFSTDTPRIVLFKNSAGKIGAIKVTEIVNGADGQIVFDLKIQK